MTSKGNLTNNQILFKYFGLVFFELQLLETLCNFIVIWQSYERKKKCGIF